MSSESVPVSAKTMSRHQIDDLLEINRRSNAHQSRLAAANRPISRPTQKARNRAQALSLSISVEAASKLDQAFISTIPLPYLDLATPQTDHVSSTDATVPIVAPVPRYPSQTGIDGLAKEMTRPGRPLLRCIIPSRVVVSDQQDLASSVAEYALTSRWSASTTGTGETDEPEDEEDIGLENPQPAPSVGVRYPNWGEDNEDMDIIVSPDEDFHPFFPYATTLSELPVVQPQSGSPLPPFPSPSLQAAPALAHSSGSETSQSSDLELVTPVNISFSLSRSKSNNCVDN